MTDDDRVAELTTQADRVAAEIAQEAAFPTKYPQLVDLLALAYIRGGRDALLWAIDDPLAESPQSIRGGDHETQ